MKLRLPALAALVLVPLVGCDRAASQKETLTGYVNPFNGTTTLWDPADLGYVPDPNPEFRTVLTESGRRPARGITRAWGAECYPGATLPHGMVQATPVTMYGSGSGYQYEDPNIYAFFHSSKGQWGLGHVPILPFTGTVTADNYHSPYSHENESARPGYYRVFLERYNINAEMTTTMRSAYHRFTYRDGDKMKLMINLSRMNNLRPVRNRTFRQEGGNAFSGSQSDIFFYATTNHAIASVDSITNDRDSLTILTFADGKEPLELQIGFSYVSVEKARKNLEAEMAGKSFDRVAGEADKTWEALLSKIRVGGGTAKQKRLLYSCLYRALQWPALRSDIDGEYTDPRGNVANGGFDYYTTNNYWDTWSCKMVLMEMIEPEVARDVIRSDIERGKAAGYLSSGFHGDFSTAFITGAYLRGIRGFDAETAYRLELNNATVPAPAGRRGGGRPYLDEYIRRGWIAENRVDNPTVKTEEDEAKAAVQKTIEYAYSDYAAAQMAKAMGDTENYDLLMERSKNYKNLFDPSIGFIRGRWADGEWITPYDPGYPYYVYMFRESNGWMSTFFAPQDPYGLIDLFPGKEAFEEKLDALFTTPFGGYEADNLTGWFGQYCAGNQPSQGISYYYYFIGKQEKAQEKLNILLNDYYGMGPEGLAYAGMDDEGGPSAWYVLNATGLYPFSPADPEYIVTVPLFDKVVFDTGGKPFTITKQGNGEKITGITYGGEKIEGYFIPHQELQKGRELVITTE